MNRSGERGTALISVIMSIVILMIALSMVTSVFFSASRLTRRAADFSAASNFAEGVLERVTAEPFNRAQTAEIRNDLPKLPGAECFVAVRQLEDGLKEVTVSVSWTQEKQRQKTTLSTLVARGAIR
ncbi:MAG: hypothetical protein Q7T82_20320 [Armatimonadota bacterium]|nr:hypothetical protein [Armatimonadota bacterium]